MSSFGLSAPKHQLQGMITGVYTNYKNDDLPNKFKYSSKIAPVLYFALTCIFYHYHSAVFLLLLADHLPFFIMFCKIYTFNVYYDGNHGHIQEANNGSIYFNNHL